MIQPLRTSHRYIFLFLAILLPVLFVAGILVRPKPPRSSMEARAFLVPGNDWQKHLFVVQISASPNGQTSLTLVQTKPFIAPDPLVYYSDHSPQKGTLPADAHLLGRWEAGASYTAPANANGFVSLYSAGQKAVLDTVSLESRR